MTSQVEIPRCSCGEAAAHVIARCKTFDDISVQIWSDGAVTCGLNTYVVKESRGASLPKAVEAAWLLADEVGLYACAELRKLAKVARRAVDQRAIAPRTYLRARATAETLR
jgi:hypothetical protein